MQAPNLRMPESNLSGPFRSFCFFALALSLAFGKVLYDWVLFALDSELYSYVLLVPFVSAYLIWIRKGTIKVTRSPCRLHAIVPFAAALVVLGGFYVAESLGWSPVPVDYLAFHMLGFVLLLFAGAVFFFGFNTLLEVAFPVGFLIFMAPLPDAVLNGIVGLLQHWSADVAYLMLKISGMPTFREGTAFQLPGFNMNVAPQCSGIHSTLVLFITSMIAAYLFLKRPWTRATLALAVLPLALLRNGFRIFVIGQLCVQISPDMINSYIHRKGGPIFFALSLIPFFFLLVLLRKTESKKKPLPRLETLT